MALPSLLILRKLPQIFSQPKILNFQDPSNRYAFSTSICLSELIPGMGRRKDDHVFCSMEQQKQQLMTQYKADVW